MKGADARSALLLLESYSCSDCSISPLTLLQCKLRITPARRQYLSILPSIWSEAPLVIKARRELWAAGAWRTAVEEGFCHRLVGMLAAVPPSSHQSPRKILPPLHFPTF